MSGRNIVYDAQFNEPNVWLMGTITAKADWSELEEGMKFEVPTTADGEFVSPAFVNNTSGDGGTRCYVKVPGFDWWKSEFMIYGTADSDGYIKIEYRGMGGDQNAAEPDGFGYRVPGKVGQRMYFNFTKEKGKIE